MWLVPTPWFQLSMVNHETCSVMQRLALLRLGTCGVGRWGHRRRRRTTYLVVVSVALSFIIYCRLLPSVISCFRLVAAAEEGGDQSVPTRRSISASATSPASSLPSLPTEVGTDPKKLTRSTSQIQTEKVAQIPQFLILFSRICLLLNTQLCKFISNKFPSKSSVYMLLFQPAGTA